MTTIRRNPAPSVQQTHAPSEARPAQSATTAQTSQAHVVGDSQSFAPQSPEQVMRKFYEAHTAKRPQDLEGLYAPDVKFKDTIFHFNDRAGTMNMWRKLLGNEDLKSTFTFTRVEGDTAYGHWDADYKVFGRQVHNSIDTRMVIRDGKIVEHEDSFSWSKWVKQALPLGGLFAGPLGGPVRSVLRAVINS